MSKAQQKTAASILQTGFATTTTPAAVHLHRPSVVNHFLRMVEKPELYLGNKGPNWKIQRPEHNEPDTGFIDRHGEKAHDGKPSDQKYFFHFDGHDVRDLLVQQGVTLCQEDESFLAFCQEIYSALFKKSTAIAREILQECGHKPKEAALIFPDYPGTRRNVLRLLAYTNSRPDEHGVIGRAHRDRAALTFAVAESNPGLMVQDNTETYQPVSPGNGVMYAFCGNKMRVLTNGKATAALHKVVMPETTLRHSKAVRWSMVFFLHPAIPVEIPSSYA